MAPVDIVLLEYLYNAGDSPPVIEAGDELRSNALAMDWIRQFRERGSDPAYASLVEVSRAPDGAIIAAHLYLFVPGNKLESIWEEWLFMLRWLATLVAVDGHFATVACEDGGPRAPELFFAFDHGLFMNSRRDKTAVYSVVTDERRELGGT
jgi:hypothetical protein